jgi:hypothetical protein
MTTTVKVSVSKLEPEHQICVILRRKHKLGGVLIPKDTVIARIQKVPVECNITAGADEEVIIREEKRDEQPSRRKYENPDAE